MGDNPYAVLLEEVRVGPRVARNRFFQVPHCNGMGYRDVRAHAEMRAVKAQGGWAVICTSPANSEGESPKKPVCRGWPPGFGCSTTASPSWIVWIRLTTTSKAR